MEIERRHFETIDSTNTFAKQHAEEFSKDKITLITADNQTAGRGRFNRRWESERKKNILASFCFFVEKQRTDLGNIPQVLSLSTAKVLQTLKFSPELKWPNDVLLNGKKVAGILAETTPLSDSLCMIIGIGLNVNMDIEEAVKIDRPATSLKIQNGQEFDVESTLLKLQQVFSVDLGLFLRTGFEPFLESYVNYFSKDKNKIIRFHDNLKVWEGTFHQINRDGSLALKLHDGEIKTFIAGEVLF